MLKEENATKIARDWNARDEASGHPGYVTRFRVSADYLARYDVRTVRRGGPHDEY